MTHGKLIFSLGVCLALAAILCPTALAGTGFFSGPVQEMDGGGVAAALGDLDGDGDLDAVMASFANESRAWINNGAGTFIPGSMMPSGVTSRGVALGDFDGDGDLDAFFVSQGPNKIWLNDGTGVFADSGQTPGSGNVGSSLAVGDLDGDTDLDVYIGYGTAQADELWFNVGGTFVQGTQPLGVNSTVSVAMGDLDGDGDLDVYLAGATANKAWLNDGSGHLTLTGQFMGNGSTWGVALGDLDGDGDLDALAANNNQNDRVWFNNGSGQFTVNVALPPSFKATWSVALGDLDGDGDLDAFFGKDDPLVAASPNEVWFNDGTGALVDTGQRLGSRFSTPGVALGDLDGDGDLDALAASGQGYPWINIGKEQKVFFVSPASGTYAKVHHSDLALSLQPTGAKPKSLRLLFNGSDVTPAVIGDFVKGTLDGGGWTFRLPDLMGALPPPGTHTLQAVVEMNDGSTVYDTAVWTMLKATEP